MGVEMSDGAKEFPGQDRSEPCTNPFRLRELKEGEKDKLGHEVEEILWLARNYAIYRSRLGVYIQFSDLPQEEDFQRKKFTEVSPELCELRYLTHEMRSTFALGFGRRASQQPSTLYEHNMAQALMLVIEGQDEDGKGIARKALQMAVERVTNDNTVRYLRSCLIFWIILIAVGATLLFLTNPHGLREYSVAAIFGATGAVLSVATRLQAFQLKPCHQSNMNNWISITRVGIGFIAGPVLVLLSQTIFSAQLKAVIATIGDTEVRWQAIAVLGLVGGFTERLVPNMLS
jgi:hypothetical protein